MVHVTNDSVDISLKRSVDESYQIIFGNKLFPQIASDLKNLLLDLNMRLLPILMLNHYMQIHWKNH